jgi:hypothetical protein
MKYSVLPLLLAPLFVLAQTNSTIQTDRPGQAINPNTISKGMFQMQQGFDYFGSNLARLKSNGFLTEQVVKYGVFQHLELNGLFVYQLDKQNTTPLSNGISSLHLGFRVHLTVQKKAMPSSGFQLRIKVPKLDREYGQKYVTPQAIYSFSYSLPKAMSLTGNLILDFDGNDFTPIGGYVANFGFPIYKKLSGFVENYGSISKGRFITKFDGGLAYLINQNIQVDLYGGGIF